MYISHVALIGRIILNEVIRNTIYIGIVVADEKLEQIVQNLKSRGD